MSLSLTRGQVANGCATGRIQLVAASTWGKLSGYFFSISSGKATMLTASNDTISGWVDIGFKPGDSNVSSDVLTVPSTTTGYEFPVYTEGTFYLPVKSGQTLAASYAFAPITVSVTSSLQTADLTNTGTKSLLIVMPPTAEEIAANIVRVMINPAKFGIGS